MSHAAPPDGQPDGALHLPGLPGPGGADSAHGAIALSPLAVLLAAALLAGYAVLSARFCMGLHKALALSAARCALPAAHGCHMRGGTSFLGSLPAAAEVPRFLEVCNGNPRVSISATWCTSVLLNQGQ